jgi:hypothetical protein
VDNYNYSSYGKDEIVLPINMDLTQLQDPELHFMVAYAPYYDGNAFIDSLKVLISNDCQQSFKVIFRSGGEALSTTTSGEWNNNLYEHDVFKPENCEEWRLVTLDLSDYAGQYVTIKFLNQSGYGNEMYLDDIGIDGILVGTTEIAKSMISIHPNPTRGAINIELPGEFPIHNLQVLDLMGKVVLEENNYTSNQPLTLESQPAGIYWIKLTDEEGTVITRKLSKL